jgi:hypothetical protein
MTFKSKVIILLSLCVVILGIGHIIRSQPDIRVNEYSVRIPSEAPTLTPTYTPTPFPTTLPPVVHFDQSQTNNNLTYTKLI